MSSTTTVTALRFAADLLAGLPGLPRVSVTAAADSIDLQVCKAGADEHTRAVAVDMLTAVLGLTPQPYRVGDGDWYGAQGLVGEFHVDVYAPYCTVVRPEVSACEDALAEALRMLAVPAAAGRPTGCAAVTQRWRLRGAS